MKLMFSIFIFYYSISLGQACINNCSQHGLCENNKCVCNWNYIGSDCSVKAYPLKIGVTLTTHELGTYYLYHEFTEDDPTSQQLDIKYDNRQSLNQLNLIVIYRVQILASQLGKLTIEYYESAYVSADTSLSVELTPDIQRIGNILIIQIDSIYNSDLTTHFGEEQKSSTKLIMAIVMPILAVVIIVIIFLCCFKKIKRLWDQRNPEPAIPPTSRQNPIYLTQRYTGTQVNDYPQQPISLFFPNDECSICLQPLINGMHLVITPCQHKFHGNCIFEVLMRQQSCPICSAQLQSNQLIGLSQLNQLQALAV